MIPHTIDSLCILMILCTNIKCDSKALYNVLISNKTIFEFNNNDALSLIAAGPKQQVVAYTEKSQDKHESRHIQLVREYGFHPRSKVSVEDGAVLPKKFEPFPENMYGRPLEEIDNFIYEEVSS